MIKTNSKYFFKENKSLLLPSQHPSNSPNKLLLNFKNARSIKIFIIFIFDLKLDHKIINCLNKVKRKQ